MGLRINNNIASIMALRNLRIADRNQLQSMERLSTGVRINSAADDPSGLVVSEQLRAQVSSIDQSITNATFASNLIGTAEAALTNVNDLLVSIRESAIFALNTGGSSTEQVAAEQDSVDQAIEAIDRIAATSRFATTNLLNGDSGFYITSQAGEIKDLRPISLTFDMRTQNTSYSLNLQQIASQAKYDMYSGAIASNTVVTDAASGSMTIRVTGSIGTEDVTVGAGATWSELADAVNILRGNTGVYASNDGANLCFYSDSYGSEEMIRIEKVSTTGAFTDAAVDAALANTGDMVNDFGADAVANLNGASVSAKGNELTLVSPFFSGSMTLDSSAAAGNSYSFTVRNSGLLFQLNTQPTPADQTVIGISNKSSQYLGKDVYTTGGVTRGGFLDTIKAGGANDLFNDPGNAVEIIDAAIDDISDTRAYLGAFMAFSVEPAIDQLEVAMENLQSSEAQIRDLDFAKEMAAYTKNQIIYQAGISVIAQANMIPQSVLQLLQ